MNLSESARLESPTRRPAERDLTAVVSTIGTAIRRFFATWAVRRRWAREVDTLYAFSDRDLWDLGLGRSDLPAIRKGTFHRD